jgi:hypothetical protein
MKRFPLLIAGLICAALTLLPAVASGQIVELGKTTTPLTAPSCPKNVSSNDCRIILTRTTALETVSDGVHSPTKVKKNGWLVAFTVGLSNLSSNVKTERTFLHSLNGRYGGAPQLAISVLKPGKNNKYTVAAVSQVFHVEPFLGQVLQEPLSLPNKFSQFIALPVTKGEVVGLTVPTWAPVLGLDLDAKKFSYRQSRMRNCTNPAGSQTAQQKVGNNTRYLCNYPGTRVEYSLTEVVNQSYPKTYVH